jgi:hypothetical protein
MSRIRAMGIRDRPTAAASKRGPSSAACIITTFAFYFRQGQDDLTRQDLALALILMKRFDDAERLLRQIAPPAAPGVQVALDGAKSPPPCMYLMWSLAMPTKPLPDRAANLYAFLGEAYTVQELDGFTDDKYGALLARVKARLPSMGEPCASLSLIDAFVALLNPQQAVSTTPIPHQ